MSVLTRFCQQQSVFKPHRQLAWAQIETDHFTPLQFSLKLFVSVQTELKGQNNKPNKVRAGANGSDLLPKESHATATANASLLAGLHKLSTATLNCLYLDSLL